MERRRNVMLHFAGAGVGKFAPLIVQFTLLLLVARAGSIDDVGRLALTSAAAFLCGAVAELGLGTTLSIPNVTFGTDGPPLRATRALRVGSAALGSVLFTVLWAAGLGGHDPALLIAVPLPFAIALALGYAGAMNASGLLRYEGAVSAAESIVILAIALLGSLAIPALTASLLALTIGRALGLVARAVLVHRMPQSRVGHVPRLLQAQAPFAVATVAIVVQGQADIVALGFLGALATAAVYGPLVRTAYSALLSAEALSWSLYGAANPEERERPGPVARHWRPLMLAVGVASAVVFVVFAQPFLHLLLNTRLPDITPAIVLLGCVIVARFAALVLNVDILRAGRQRDELPVLGAAALVVAVGGAVAAAADSLTGLAGARLASEVVIAAGYLVIRSRPPKVAPPEPRPEPPVTAGPPRLLFLTPFPPRLDAAHGGRVTAQLILRLAASHPVAIVCLRDVGGRETDEEIRRHCDLVVEVPHTVKVDRSPFSARVARLSRMVRRVPGVVDRAAAAGYAERLRTVAAEWQPDIVQIELHEMARYMSALDGCAARRVLVEHDPGTSAARELARVSGRLDRIGHVVEASAWRRYARRTFDSVDAVVVFTERDRSEVTAIQPSARVVCIPFGADVPKRALDATGVPPPTLLLFGGYEHPPNADAALRLMVSIHPCVAARHPDVRIDIVGSKPTRAMRRLAVEGVTITGWVPSVEPYLDSAAMVVVPLRLGGGMRVKVLETLAAGKALVASPRAVEGLDLVAGRDFIEADTDDEFCRAVCELLEDPVRRAELGHAARVWAEQNLRWDAAVDAYEELYASLSPSPREEAYR